MTRSATVSVDQGTNAGRLRFDAGAVRQCERTIQGVGNRRWATTRRLNSRQSGFVPPSPEPTSGASMRTSATTSSNLARTTPSQPMSSPRCVTRLPPTSHIRLLAGPANFVTRDPGVIASGVAAVQVASGGRAICGIARGDSAVMLAGKRPQRHDDLVRDLGFLQTYLGGGALEFGAERSSLEWLGDLPYTPVPVELVCSGPRTIALAAAVADRIGLSVGANPERIRWAMEIIDASLAEHGRTRADITVCAYLPIAVSSDRESGRKALVSRTAGWAHMSSFPGNDLASQPAILQRVTTKLRAGYDYRFHNESAPLENAEHGHGRSGVRRLVRRGRPAVVCGRATHRAGRARCRVLRRRGAAERTRGDGEPR